MLTGTARFPTDKKLIVYVRFSWQPQLLLYPLSRSGELSQAWNTCCASALARRQWTANFEEADE
jgi:hypothetical protein